MANGPLIPESPVKSFVRPSTLFAFDVGQQIHSIELPRGIDLRPGRGERGRQNVELNDRILIRLAHWNMAFPLNAERHARAALPGLRFIPAQRVVA
jgi:hypothetical protein